jgi:hypothetical protein
MANGFGDRNYQVELCEPFRLAERKGPVGMRSRASGVARRKNSEVGYLTRPSCLAVSQIVPVLVVVLVLDLLAGP